MGEQRVRSDLKNENARSNIGRKFVNGSDVKSDVVVVVVIKLWKKKIYYSQ